MFDSTTFNRLGFNRSGFNRLKFKARLLLLLVVVTTSAVSEDAYTDNGLSESQPEAQSLERPKSGLRYRFKTLDDPMLDQLGGQWSTVQDHQGFLWFGADGGLARYDGYHMKLFQHKPEDPSSLSNDNIQNLLVDKQGRLWVATAWGLNLFDPDTDGFIRYMHDLSSDFGQAKVDGYIPVVIPATGAARIEAEVVSAFRENTPFNQGNASCSNTALDAQKTEDVGGGCNVAWTRVNEWLEYIIDVQIAGIYDINIRAATAQGDISLHLEVDGFNVSGKVPIRQTGWQIFNDQIVPVKLTAGLHTVRLLFDTGDVNVNYLSISKASGVNEDELYTESKPIKSKSIESKTAVTDSKPSKKVHTLTHNGVSSLLQDRAGHLWVGTSFGGLNRFSFKGEKTKHFIHRAGETNSISENTITALLEDKQGGLWIGTRNQGLDRYDPLTETFQHYSHNANEIHSLDNNYVLTLYEDNQNQLWVGTTGGLNRFDKNSGRFTRYLFDPNDPSSIAGNYVRGIVEDQNGRLWVISDGGGISVFNRSSDTFERYVAGTNDSNDLVNNKIRSIFKDSSGGLWFGHYPAGVSVLDPYASAFRNYQGNIYDVNSLSNSDILSVTEDKKGNLWVGTEAGLNYLDRATDKVTRYLHDPKIPTSLVADPVLSVLEDSQGVVWVGTWQGGLSRFDPKTSTFSHYRDQANNTKRSQQAQGKDVRALYEDSNGRVWVGSEVGVSRIERAADNLVDYNLVAYNGVVGNGSYLSSQVVEAFYDDRLGNFWVGGSVSLDRIIQETGTVEHYAPNPEDPDSLGGNGIRSVLEDSSGRIWVASFDGGLNLFDPQTKFFKTYTADDGLSDNAVGCILQDDSGLLWLGTAHGLSRFNPETDTFSNFTKEHGLPGNLYKRGACTKTRWGELVFGSSKGLTIFDPRNVAKNLTAPPVAIIDLKIFNESVPLGAPSSPLKKAITQTKILTLDHKQSVFSFEFVALNYTMPGKNQYAYRLEGFDQRWNYVGTRRTATYTNLDAGSYIFRVKASNNDGVWNESGTAIVIHILPPWWRSWWAYSVYLLMFIALGGLIGYTRWNKKRAEYEYKVNQKLRDLDKVKDAFLANTSHELRTPLNGVIGLSESLIAGIAGQLPQRAVSNLKLIVSSSKRLAYLIDDILDFSKLKEHSITLNRSAVDLHNLIDMIFNLTQPLVGTKPIKLVNKVDKYLASILADENRLQQILYNLVGNAIKFTDEGSVSVSAVMEGDLLWVEVRDTGIGIDEGDVEKVFAAFEQVDSSESRQFGGTGLGLAVTKQLVELHGGMIDLSSEGGGRGATVRFSLSSSGKAVVGEGARSLKDIAWVEERENIVEEEIDEAVEGGIDEREDRTVTNDSYHILVVDDEPINRQVLTNLLSLIPYRITECNSGKQALDLLCSGTESSDTESSGTQCSDPPSQKIDLVLLDVMMPGITGYQVCATIRETYSASQLPILFLTAKSQVGDLEAGYAAGGNDFLTKPVAKEELFARIKTHLQLLDVNRHIEAEVLQRTQDLNLSYKRIEQAYEHLKQAQSQLVQSEKMSALGTLVAGVGHEINNPTTFSNIAATNIERGLNDFKQLLQRLVSDDEEEIMQTFDENFDRLFGQLSSLHNANKRTAEIVANLRTFSRSDTLSLDADDMPKARLGKGLQSTLELVSASYKTSIQFVCEIACDPQLPCQSSELNQVFMNVMVNACQAMAGSPSASLIIKMDEKGKELCISFTDNGCGMPQAVIDKMFDPFFTTKPDGEGTGLGMSISFGIIERHKGRLEVVSEEGKGTQFYIYLPLNLD